MVFCLPTLHPRANGLSFVLEAHILAAMFAYSLFTIGVLHAGLMSIVEKHLHHATLPRALRGLPPLLTMEILLFRIIGAGFVLLTMTLASGVIFSDQLFGKPWQFNHKMLFGFISWCVFAVLLLGHYYKGWRGRTAVRWTVSGFVFIIYLGPICSGGAVASLLLLAITYEHCKSSLVFANNTRRKTYGYYPICTWWFQESPILQCGRGRLVIVAMKVHRVVITGGPEGSDGMRLQLIANSGRKRRK